LQPAPQRGEALLVEREVPPGALVEVVHAAVLPGRVVEDGAPRRHVQGLPDRWRLLKLGFRFLQTVTTLKPFQDPFKIADLKQVTVLSKKRNKLLINDSDSAGRDSIRKETTRTVTFCPRNLHASIPQEPRS